MEEHPTFLKKMGEVPCMRNSYFYGIWSGIGSGLAYFMFSSKPRVSTHVGFAGFVVTTLSYWTYCRHNYSKQQEQVRLFQAFLRGDIDGIDTSLPISDEGPVSVSNPLTSV